MNTTFTEFVSLTKIDCGQCGASYAINERYRAQKAKEGGTWHCPYCQVGWGYSNSSENARLKRELEAKQVELTKARCATLEANTAKDQAERKCRRVIKRVHAGVCPCCNRTFSNLQRHMATKHPDKVPSLTTAK